MGSLAGRRVVSTAEILVRRTAAKMTDDGEKHDLMDLVGMIVYLVSRLCAENAVAVGLLQLLA